eukprot:g5021.t1
MYHSDMKASDKAKAMRKSPFHVRFYKMLDTTLKYLRNPPGTSKAGKITARQKREAEELRKKKQQMMKFKQGAQQKRNNLLKLRRNRQHKLFQRYDVSKDGYIGVLEMRGLIHEMKQLRPKVDYPETPEHLENLVKLIKRNKRIYGNSRSDLQISEDELNVWLGNEMARPAKVKEALRKKNEFYLCVCNLSDTILQWLRTPQDIQNQIKPLSIKELHILDRKAREEPTKKQKMILRKQLIRMEQARKEAEKRRIESERLKKMTLRDKRKEIAAKQLAQQKIVQAKLQKAKLRQRKRARRNANQAMKITQQKRNELEQHILNAEMKEEEQWLNIAKPVKYKERHGKQQVRIYRQRKLNQSNIHVPPIMTLNKDVGYITQETNAKLSKETAMERQKFG